MTDRRLEDRYVRSSEQFVGPSQRFLDLERVHEHATGEVEAGEGPNAVALVGQRLHRRIALPLVGILP